jgi:hypothetical protein
MCKKSSKKNMILYSSMSSFFNREDRLDREFAYFREKREENEILKEENNNLKKENEILKEEINKLKEQLSFCNHLKAENKWYENYIEEAMLKYMHDYDYFQKKEKQQPFPKYKFDNDISDDEDLLENLNKENNNKELKSKNPNYMKEWRKKNPNYYRDYYRKKKSNQNK